MAASNSRMTLRSGVFPARILVVRSCTVDATNPNSPTCPGTPHFVHPGSVSSQSTPSGYICRKVSSEWHATLSICVSNLFRGIGSSLVRQ